jgi:hypothetical protein
MWEPRRLTTLWASTVCCRDSFTTLLEYIYIYIYIYFWENDEEIVMINGFTVKEGVTPNHMWICFFHCSLIYQTNYDCFDAERTQYNLNPVIKRTCENITLKNKSTYIIMICRSQWPRGLRHELSSPTPTLGSWVRISLEAGMSVCVYCVFVLLCV